MRKKEIEAVPYITVSIDAVKEGAGYVAATAWKNFGNKRHILLEVYRNDETCLKTPLVRYVANHKEWAVFYPAPGVWTKESIDAGGDLVWRKAEIRQGLCLRAGSEEAVLRCRQDLDRIRNFFRKITVWDDGAWQDYFKKHEDGIRHAADRKKRTARHRRLEERIKATPELREQEILDWAGGKMNMSRHYLYYKVQGRKADVCCSACGGVAHAWWDPGELYEDAVCKKRIPKPYEGGVGHCILCGLFGIYRPQGKAKHLTEEKISVFTADKYKNDGVVLRYVDVFKTWGLQTVPDGRGQPEMLGAYEEMEAVEVARTYFVPGKKPQTDYHKHNPYMGGSYWDDCNLYGMNNIVIRDSPVHPAAWEALKGTFLQYSAMDEYVRERGTVNALEYLERYTHWPQIEMLVRMKLYGVASSMISGRCGIIAGPAAARPEDFLGIRKDQMKLLIETKGDLEVLDILQTERRMGQRWTPGQVMALAEISPTRHQLDRALAVMTVQKLLNNISGYAGCGYGTGCRSAVERLRNTAITYFDYLDMRADLGYDLANTVYQKPRNLPGAHHEMVMEMNREEMDARLKDVAQRYPNIRKRYRKLKNRYFYADENFLIRPAVSAEEIVMEGRVLHHCVGRDIYLRKHDEGESIILLLRRQTEPGIPYITAEVRNGHIVQWYGAYDRKPDERNMQEWLGRYTTILECRRKGLAG